MSSVHYPQYAKQKSLFEVLCIAPHKPDVSRILDTMIVPTVMDYNVIETPQGRSYEGQQLLGVTLIINLQLTEKLTYMSQTSQETVHSMHYTTLQNISLSLPKEIVGQDTTSRIKAGTFAIHPSIESIYSQVFNPRTIHQTTLLLVNISLH